MIYRYIQYTDNPERLFFRGQADDIKKFNFSFNERIFVNPSCIEEVEYIMKIPFSDIENRIKHRNFLTNVQIPVIDGHIEDLVLEIKLL
jgi:hypothetical protein